MESRAVATENIFNESKDENGKSRGKTRKEYGGKPVAKNQPSDSPLTKEYNKRQTEKKTDENKK